MKRYFISNIIKEEILDNLKQKGITYKEVDESEYTPRRYTLLEIDATVKQMQDIFIETKIAIDRVEVPVVKPTISNHDLMVKVLGSQAFFAVCEE